MQLISHRSQIAAIPESPLRDHIQARFGQLFEDTDVPPTIIILTPDTDLESPELSFLGETGIYSDMFNKHQPGEQDFRPVFEWISFDPSVPVYEMLYLEGDLGYTFIFGPEVVDAHPKLKAVVDSQPLSPPQPLF